jgi:hypothetical protein
MTTTLVMALFVLVGGIGLLLLVDGVTRLIQIQRAWPAAGTDPGMLAEKLLAIAVVIVVAFQLARGADRLVQRGPIITGVVVLLAVVCGGVLIDALRAWPANGRKDGTS